MKARRGVTLAWWAVAVAALAAGRAAGAEPPATVKIVLWPAAEPRPALKYLLLPPLVDRKPGNAAVYYNRIPAERSPLFGSSETWQKLSKWQEAPLAEIRRDEVRSTLQGLQPVLGDLDRAARCESCDWQLLGRMESFFTVDLAEFQQTRSYARMLAPWVRLRIADGKFDDAVHGLQTGYALARDVAKAPTLVNGLVGCAIAGVMNRQLQEMIQQPGSPNLYWALRGLPRPLIDLGAGFEGERYLLTLSFPELRDLESKNYTPEYWQQLLERSTEQFYRFVGGPKSPEEQIGAMAWLLRAYPRAKRFLVERGRSPAEVEAMPVPQVILLATVRSYEESRDDVFKWLALPYAEGSMRGDQEALLRRRAGDEIIPLASALLPAIIAPKSAEVRIDREIALFRVFEALRLFGAGHGGQLPQRLEEITEVAVPLDPVHGRPFGYHRQGDAAILEVIGRPGPMQYWEGVRFEITLAAKGR